MGGEQRDRCQSARTTLGTVRPSLLSTTKRRRSRITSRQAAALDRGSPRLVRLDAAATDLGLTAIPSLLEHLADSSRWVLDIGFGTGEPVEQSARRDPDTAIIAVDVHTPGIGDLVHRIENEHLTNVVVVEGDVRQLLPALPPEGLAGVRIFFPDPWPKKRHHRRRLVNASFATELARYVQPSGFWHLATDWPDYADHMEVAIAESGRWRGGRIARPDQRPVTRFERNALAAGRPAIDLWFERMSP
jgi:tRNA (guanine-N7-)-methyltransferase